MAIQFLNNQSVTGTLTVTKEVTIGTTTPIAGSMLTVSKTTDAISGTNVGVFNNISHSGSAANATLYSEVSRLQYSQPRSYK